ncbi:MAG: hypothetical protein AAB573_03020 [Patescibacteria group bacterium]
MKTILETSLDIVAVIGLTVFLGTVWGMALAAVFAAVVHLFAYNEYPE